MPVTSDSAPPMAMVTGMPTADARAPIANPPTGTDPAKTVV
jgi:hypothetical protein